MNQLAQSGDKNGFLGVYSVTQGVALGYWLEPLRGAPFPSTA